VTSLGAQGRIAWLLAELHASGSVTLAGAAEELEISEMTVRRDLRALEEIGQARRVRGGAVSTGPVSFRGREQTHGQQKQEIAEKLLPLIPATGMIAFDSSSTINRLAMSLMGASDLIVVTNSIETMHVLRDRPGIQTVLTGGTFDARSDSLVGPVATACVAGMRFDAYFGSAAAVDLTLGCFEQTFEEAEMKRAMALSARRVVIGANSAKLNNGGSALSVKLEDMDILCSEITKDDARFAEMPAGVQIL
jgi:DeoR/GlpR family transcriptional regulator of sugar metabolism